MGTGKTLPRRREGTEDAPTGFSYTWAPKGVILEISPILPRFGETMTATMHPGFGRACSARARSRPRASVQQAGTLSEMDIERFHASDPPIRGKAFFDSSPSRPPHRGSRLWVGQKLPDRFREGLRICS